MQSRPTEQGVGLRRRESVSSISSMRSVRSMTTPREVSTDSLLVIEDRFVRKPRAPRMRRPDPRPQPRLSAHVSFPPPSAGRSTYYFPNGEVFRPRMQPRPKSAKHSSLPNMGSLATGQRQPPLPAPAAPVQEYQPVPETQQMSQISNQPTGSSASSASPSSSVDHSTPASSITCSEEEDDDKKGLKGMFSKLLRKDKKLSKRAEPLASKSNLSSESSLESLSLSAEPSDDSSSFIAGDDRPLDGGDLDSELEYISSIIGIGETSFFDDESQDKLIRRESLSRKSLEKQKSLSRKNTLDSQATLDAKMHCDVAKPRTFGNGEFEVVTTNSAKEPGKSCAAARSALSSRSASPQRVSFSDKIYLNETFSADHYVRFNRGLKHSYSQLARNPAQIKEIRAELNHYKLHEMAVHEQSREYTHYFRTA
ncbi:hypothetical protein KL933_003584 [Ogataea haglerorum]|uniref:Uncharacterized protein n=1 Tax=Ogataea haglerorum TaxID=1937702 RepID=A0AAN6D3E5_9ASCO|nr:hypothetical protein KL933_003584 [Ogataea haglerorum]KAG7729615.1 hypothetical protein KL948_003769 [Ogataea haglerorum]KAG7736934.1 hypothetical protein KL923_004072 [Ogataea haglerorum]KAG7786573.1 hypothetical protein KL910_003973 [Ogataea haglerorum]KAG7787686.1 hypothetical protein KL945_002835 [Ogataea haglerorum]